MLTLIQPLQKDAALLKDFASADPGKGVCVWWLGQSGFLVKSAKSVVLFDPYLSDSLTNKYRGTDKPHVRMTAQAVLPGELRGIDLVTSTHNHTDHLDAETLLPLLAANPGCRLLIPEANRAFVCERLGCDAGFPVGIADGQQTTIGDISVHAVPAAHNSIDRDDQGRCKHLGYIVDFGGLKVYHSGDTLRYHGMAERLKPFSIDIAMLPINGDRPERRVAGNLSGAEAAQLAYDAGIGVVIPCHYEMFEFNTATPQQFQDACAGLGQPHKTLRCGERFDRLPGSQQ